jgi:hypothetical protein
VEEDVEVSRGFPEAVAAYLRAEHIAPVMLFRHVTPPGLSLGLRTVDNNAVGRSLTSP